MNISAATLTLFGSSGTGGIGGVGGQMGMRRQRAAADMQTMADTLGISADQLKQELGSGSSLAQVAKNHGKTANDLINALQAKDKAKLDQAVSDGKITGDQEARFLAQLKGRETNFVNGTRPSGPPPGPPPGQAGASGLASLDDLATLLGQSGLGSSSSTPTTSIGQALRAYGVDPASMEKTLLQGIKSGLDQAVSGGKLSQAQESDLMKQITSSLDQAFATGGTPGTNGTSSPTSSNLADLLFKQNATSPGSDQAAASASAASWFASINIDFAA